MTDETYPVLREVLAEQAGFMDGWAVEFGVWSGESLSIIAEHMPVIGFDSFEGLPEDWRPEFPEGAFGPDDPDPDRLLKFGAGLLPPACAMVVPGWFKDTVPSFPFPTLSLVHIDCDVYSSTVTALDGIIAHIQRGTILVFDEFHGYPGWEQHEAKAFDEWCQKYQVDYGEIAVGAEERAFRINGVMGWV